MSGDYSCWEGWELQGKVRTTILRGQVLVEDEEFVGPKDAGKFVPRQLLPEIVNAPLRPEETLASQPVAVATA